MNANPNTPHHPPPGRIIAVMVASLEDLRNKHLQIAPRGARLLDDGDTPTRRAIAALHRKPQTQEAA
jgi:hypothetical protein